MANPTITNVDLGSVILSDEVHKDELLTFAGAGTEVEGTILARQEVAEAIVAAAGSNTGNGTATLAAVVTGPVVPLVGAYNLECVTAVTHGGVFKLVDPNGAIVANSLAMTASTGAATVLTAAGMTVTLTDGSTDFAVGDEFSLTVASGSGKSVPFEKDGVGGAQVPKRVLTYDVTAAGAGDVAIRSMVSGMVRLERLVIDSDGDASNVDKAVVDQLRDYAIIPKGVQELSELDNQ